MYLKSLVLEGFRNYLYKEFRDFQPLNILYGENGTGKTNLLEAIGILANLTSPRFANQRDLINWDKSYYRITGDVVNAQGNHQITVYYDKKGDRAVYIDRIKQDNRNQLSGMLNVVFFSPDDLFLIKGGPAYRRRFLDTELSQLSFNYREWLQKYRQVLRQRNFLLGKIKYEPSARYLMESWDEQLIDLGSKIVFKRLEFVAKLRPLLKKNYGSLTGDRESLDISYLCSVDRVKEGISINQLKEYFFQKLKKVHDEEINRKVTLCGPQRDELQLTFLKGVDTRTYASQGQQRTMALALRLAELELIRAENGEYPLLLLDDVFSELDFQRRKYLLNTVDEGVQTFITTTEVPTMFLGETKAFKIPL